MSKLDEAISIITALGFPRAQQNERSALSLLALIQLHEKGSWQRLQEPMLGVRAILDFCRNDYDKPYAENSRESFRKETLHQFVAGGLALQNPDDPARSPNSPKWCYQISPEAKALLTTFGTKAWEPTLRKYLAAVETLADRYKKARDMNLVPCTMPDGKVLQLSPGKHSELIRDIIEQFAPRFAPGGKIVYIGDTGNKGVVFDEASLAALGIALHERGKMPDVVIHDTKHNWLLLIESVISSGPMDGKRHEELTELLKHSKAGLVFITAFPNRTRAAKSLPVLAWETEVWIADNPDHLIHFNGNRYLGPHTK
ncbi:MAG TPA: BsuBI/PstI family type II restriction endonuclease [Gallionella sp.]|nr:BsuBI/PstI family type II restriction endonuclease [Gallionella sp.]